MPRLRWVPLLALAILLATDVTAAQEEPSIEAPVADESVGAEPAAPASPAAEPFDATAAIEEYMSRQTPEEKERSDAYFEGGYWLQLWGLIYGVALAWLLLSTRVSARMRDFAERISRRKPLQTAIYVAQYMVVATVLSFPMTLYQGFLREHKYDLATQTFGPWFKEQMIGLAVGLVLMSLLMIPLYGVFRKAPRTWWLWGSVVGIVFLVFMILIAPVYVDPLFNTYEQLEEGPIRDSILSMARANGIETNDVYQFDASRQTTRISANVSGFMNTMRIRLNDNLLERCSEAEIEAVMGHEIGHYALNHIYEMIVVFGVILAAGFGFIRWSFDRVVARWGEKWGVRGISDTAGLPLLGALFGIFFFVLTPINNTLIRTNEAEADLFGLNAAREPDGFAEVALKLGEYRKLDPGPLEEWLFFDHPSGRSRITMAMEWKAEHTGNE